MSFSARLSTESLCYCADFVRNFSPHWRWSRSGWPTKLVRNLRVGRQRINCSRSQQAAAQWPVIIANADGCWGDTTLWVHFMNTSERERGNVSKMQGLLRCKVRGLRIHKSNHSQETAHSLQGTTATYCNVGQRCPFIFVAAFPQSLCCSENHSGASFLPVNLYFALALKVFYRGWAWERKRSELRTQPALALNFDGAFPLEVCHRPSQA